MILSDGQVLDSVRFNALIRDQATNYQRSLPLRFLDRTPSVDADDDEITGTFTGRVFAADVIADDAKAVVYEAGKLELVTNALPNIKVGKRFSQAMIARLGRIARNLGSAGMRGEVDVFRNWETRTGADLLRGVDERKNALLCAMMIDALTYNRLGVQITGTWGMPSDLKSTPSTLWTSTSATPVTDVLTMKAYAANTYGEAYDKMTLATADFNNMVATTEFKNTIQGVIRQPLAVTAFNALDPQMRRFAADILGVEIELEDKLITEKASDGTFASSRVLPLGKVLLSVASDEGGGSAYDFGNAVVVESIVAGLVGDPDNVPGGEQYGPMGYYTGNPGLDPPQLIAWAVARGFPRKHRVTCTSVLTVR